MKYKISSPGKVILHGEHSVVYGKPALAGVIGMRTYLDLSLFSESEVASIHLEDLDCTYEIQLSEVNMFLYDFQNRYTVNGNIFNSVDTLLMELRNQFSKKIENSLKSEGSNNSQQKNALLAIYYLLCGCFVTRQLVKGKAIVNGFQISFHSNMKIGSGLGSSASFGVSFATVFLLLSEQINIETYKTDKALSLISQWAFQSERIMHGNPSGLDNTVCTYGGIIHFTKGNKFVQIKLEKPLNLLVIDSHVQRSTGEILAKVNELRENYPKLIDCIWSAMEELVNEATPIYEKIGKHCIETDYETFKKLERLYQVNNDLLKTIGVSHPKLETVFSIAHRHGFSSKLTGAGGGGYAIIPLRDGYAETEDFKTLCKELIDADFEAQKTTVGGSGVDLKKIL